jgi:hypothetical protein
MFFSSMHSYRKKAFATARAFVVSGRLDWLRRSINGGYYNKSLDRLLPMRSFLFVRLCKQTCNAANQKSPRYREGS